MDSGGRWGRGVLKRVQIQNYRNCVKCDLRVWKTRAWNLWTLMLTLTFQRRWETYRSCAPSLQSCPPLCDPRVCSQAPLSTGFSRQEYLCGLPCPPPGDLPDPGIRPTQPPGKTSYKGGENFFLNIAALSCCVSLCYTAKWIGYTFTYTPLFGISFPPKSPRSTKSSSLC